MNNRMNVFKTSRLGNGFGIFGNWKWTLLHAFLLIVVVKSDSKIPCTNVSRRAGSGIGDPVDELCVLCVRYSEKPSTKKELIEYLEREIKKHKEGKYADVTTEPVEKIVEKIKKSLTVLKECCSDTIDITCNADQVKAIYSRSTGNSGLLLKLCTFLLIFSLFFTLPPALLLGPLRVPV